MDEKKCAAGFLIADDEYNPSIEKTWGELVLEGVVPHEFSFLINSLQDAHDTLAIEELNLRDSGIEFRFQERIDSRFFHIAKKFNLEMPDKDS